MNIGKLFVISGPSGVGKGTVIKAVLAESADCCLAISATTRQKRPGEVHGKDYFFLSDAEFDQHILDESFVEWCQVFNYRYGTLKTEIAKHQEAGKNVILEIDVQGASKIRQKKVDAVFVFIAPPSFEDLEKRLKVRDTESDHDLRLRLETAKTELAEAKEFDWVVVNQDIQETVEALKARIINT